MHGDRPLGGVASRCPVRGYDRVGVNAPGSRSAVRRAVARGVLSAVFATAVRTELAIHEHGELVSSRQMQDTTYKLKEARCKGLQPLGRGVTPGRSTRS